MTQGIYVARRSGVPLWIAAAGWLLAAGAIGYLITQPKAEAVPAATVAATAPAQPKATPPTEPTLSPEERLTDAEKAELAQTLDARLFKKAEQLEIIVAGLEKDLAVARADAQRYKDGLGRAVDELNRLSQKQATRQFVSDVLSRSSSRPSSSASTSSSDGGRDSIFVREPRFRQYGSQGAATGTIHNLSGNRINARVEVTLYENGGVMDRRTASVSIDHRRVESWDVRFEAILADGNDYSVDVNLVDW